MAAGGSDGDLDERGEGGAEDCDSGALGGTEARMLAGGSEGAPPASFGAGLGGLSGAPIA